MMRATRCGLLRLATSAAIILIVPAGASGQVQQASEKRTAERCRTPEYTQFDFWLGGWNVRSADGKLIGTNEITRISGGCGLLEHWRGAGGSSGVSLNHYDAERGKWTQRWVGEGASLWLEGGMQGSSMVLTGTTPRHTPQGDVLDRITWTPLADGRVSQVWEISPDSGKKWRTLFEGFYEHPGGPNTDVTVQTAAVSAPELTIARLSDSLEWRRTRTGAAFASIEGNPAAPGEFILWMRMPPNWEMRPHTHNTPEHITVLSGTLYMKFSPAGETVTLPAGSAVVVPQNHPMWASTREKTIVQIHGVGPFATEPVAQAP